METTMNIIAIAAGHAPARVLDDKVAEQPVRRWGAPIWAADAAQPLPRDIQTPVELELELKAFAGTCYLR
jgi:hypothetical protein